MEYPIKRSLLQIALLAFCTRLFFILIFPGPNYFAGISNGYFGVAANILAGKGIVAYVDVAPLSLGAPQWSYEPFIDRPLGYLFLILLPYAFDSSGVIVQIVHAVVAAGSAILLFLVGRLIFTEKVARMSALLFALWPLSARFEIAPLPDSLMSFVLLLSTWLLLEALRKPKLNGYYLGLGIALGVGMTLRPDVMLLPFFLVPLLFFLKGNHRVWRPTALIFCGVLLLLVPHTLRNYFTTNGQILPLGLGNGISMWEGISQFGDTLGTVFGDERMSNLEGYQTWAYPNGIERDRKRFREAFGIIADHPLWYGGMMLKRIPVLLTPDWIMSRKFAPSLKEHLTASPSNSVQSYSASYPLATLVRALLIALQYCSLVLALVGIWKGRSVRALWLPAMIIIYYIVIHIPTNTEARYFYPAIPFVLLLASSGWRALRASRQSVTPSC